MAVELAAKTIEIGFLDDDGNFVGRGDALFPENFPTEANDVVFKAQVENTGDEAATDFDVTFLLVGGTFSSEVRIEATNVDNPTSIGAGSTEDVFSHAPDDSQGQAWEAVAGTHNFRVFVDSDDEIEEDDFGNNILDRTFRVQEAPVPTPSESDRIQTQVPWVRVEVRETGLNRAVGRIASLAGISGSSTDFTTSRVLFFHLYNGVSKDNPYEVTDKPTQQGGVVGEPIRKSSETFRLSLRLAGELRVPQLTSDRGNQTITQNVSLESQILQVEKLQGKLVRVFASKSKQTINGFVQDVRFNDDTDSDNAVEAQIIIKQPSAGLEEGGASGVGLARFNVPFLKEGGDPAQDVESNLVDDDPFLSSMVQGGGVAICKPVSPSSLRPSQLTVVNRFGKTPTSAEMYKEQGGALVTKSVSDLDALGFPGTLVGVDSNGNFVLRQPILSGPELEGPFVGGGPELALVNVSDFMTERAPLLDEIEGGIFVRLSSILEEASGYRLRRGDNGEIESLPPAGIGVNTGVVQLAPGVVVSNSRNIEDRSLDIVNKILRKYLDDTREAVLELEEGEDENSIKARTTTLVRETSDTIIPAPPVEKEDILDGKVPLDRILVPLAGLAQMNIEGLAFGECEPR